MNSRMTWSILQDPALKGQGERDGRGEKTSRSKYQSLRTENDQLKVTAKTAWNDQSPHNLTPGDNS